jgi:hypothetical protein
MAAYILNEFLRHHFTEPVAICGLKAIAMMNVTYHDMVRRYGSAQAFGLLLTVEKLAKIKHDTHSADEETRFQRALAALENINFAVGTDDTRRSN